MLNKNILLKIKEVALKIDHDVAFGGKSKGNRHLFRVVKLAKYMAMRLGANVSIVEAGAWLHDTALPSGNDYNYKKNKEIVKAILGDVDLSEEDSDRIAECVASHEGTSRPKSLEAKIVHDSDVLEKSGVLGLIRHTWKLANSGKILPDNITKKDARGILSHLKWRSRKLQTSLGKKMYIYLFVPVTFPQTEEIISIVAKRAVKGITTEEIAGSIYKKLTATQREKLKEQLSQSYLKEL